MLNNGKRKKFFPFYDVSDILKIENKMEANNMNENLKQSSMIHPKYEGNKIAYWSNDFIRYSTALKPLDEFEINFFIYLCYKAKENLNLQTGKGWDDIIKIDMQKLLEGFTYKKSWSKYNADEKNELYNKLKKLRKKDFEIRTDKYKTIVNDSSNALVYEYQLFSYITYVHYVPETWTMEVQLDKRTQEFLCTFEKGGFTPVMFKNILALKSKYAKILYVYFRSYRDGAGMKGSSYTIEHLRKLLGVEEKYEKWGDFKRYILLPAIQEINEKTDIFIFGRRDKIVEMLKGKKVKDISEKECTKIMLNSMCETSTKGKSIYKLTFQVEKCILHSLAVANAF